MPMQKMGRATCCVNCRWLAAGLDVIGVLLVAFILVICTLYLAVRLALYLVLRLLGRNRDRVAAVKKQQ